METNFTQQPVRKLSPWRVMLSVVILVGVLAGSFYGLKWWKAEQIATSDKPWFASYVDVTAKPTFAFEEATNRSKKDVVLSFIVSKPDDACVPTWGGAYTLEQASGSLDLERRIARLKQQGGNVAVSFGGLKNDELAVNCQNPDELVHAYKAVVDHYDISTIDLDLEQNGLTNADAGARRASAIAKLQQQRREQGKTLAVWVTLPATPQGLTEDGTNAITQLLISGVDIAGLNVMTMNYGQSLQGMTVLEGSKEALTNTHRQLDILYERAGTTLNSATLWRKIGATPMIGQTDIAEEIFKVDDAKEFNKFAISKGIGRMSMWSLNRDISCGGNYVDVTLVSVSCSGVTQNPGDFTEALSRDFNGNLVLSSGIVTKSEVKANQEADDPATSPYQIWSASGAYLQGTKVVWKHNVYEAKWWTQGNSPDNPVLQTWETPWKLVGPVLPGEKPIKQATLPAGTYPEWSGTTNYETSQRVLFNGVPYQAKWWNQGQSPAAAISNPNSSPWVPLTQEQINEVGKNQ